MIFRLCHPAATPPPSPAPAPSCLIVGASLAISTRGSHRNADYADSQPHLAKPTRSTPAAAVFAQSVRVCECARVCMCVYMCARVPCPSSLRMRRQVLPATSSTYPPLADQKLLMRISVQCTQEGRCSAVFVYFFRLSRQHSVAFAILSKPLLTKCVWRPDRGDTGRSAHARACVRVCV